MKKVNFISFVLTLTLIGCSTGTAQKKEITPEGVTGLRMGEQKPEFPTPYTVEFFEDDYEGYSKYIVKDGDGNVVLEYEPTYLIEVYSPEYETAEGISVGDTFGHAMKTLGDNGKTPALEYYRDSADFYFNIGGDIYFVLPPSALMGGQERYNEWYLRSGDSNELKFTDFSDDAIITRIRIRK